MYETFYALKGSPFRLSPDPSFFFGSPGHSRALSYLRYGLNQKEGFIVVTGNPGTGKTTLARALLKELGREKIVVAELNSTQLDADDVLRMVAATFGIEHENQAKATLLKKLEAFFIAKYRGGYHSLIMIDEAQNLPKRSLEELRMLSNFYIANHALVQIFLLGQQQFRDILNAPEMEQLRQRVVAACHLEALNELETREYIEHRLKCVGWQGNPQITDDAFIHIARLTHGIPRRINTFCDRLFLYASLEELSIIGDKAVQAVGRELMYEVTLKNGKGEDASEQLSPLETQQTVMEPAILPAPVTQESVHTMPEPSESNSTFVTDLPVSASTQVVSAPQDLVPAVSDTIKRDADEMVAQHASASVTEREASAVKDEKPEVKPDEPPAARRVVKTPLRIVSSSPQATGSAERSHNVSQVEVPETITDSAQQGRDWLELVAIAWDYYQHPSGQHQLSNVNIPLHDAISDLIKVAVGRLVVPAPFVESRLKNVSQEDIKQAARFYIKEVLLCGRADYYRRLGVKPGASLEQIKSHYRYLFRLFQPDQEVLPEKWDETYTRRINQAYGVLRDVEKRRKYDAFLHGVEHRELHLDSGASHSEMLETSQQFQDVFADSSRNASSSEGETTLSANRKRNVVLIVAGLLMLVSVGVFVAVTGKFGSIENVLDSQQAAENSLVERATQDIISGVGDKAAIDPTESVTVNTGMPGANDANVLMDNADDRPRTNSAQETMPPAETNSTVADNSDEKQSKRKKTTAKTVDDSAVADNVLAEETPVKKSKAKKTSDNENVDAKESASTNRKRDVVTSPVPVVPVVAPVSASTSSEKNTPTPVEALADNDLNDVLKRFIFTYEEGDIGLFMQLFSADASTNDVSGKENIQRDYQSLFKTTDLRVIELKNIKWSKTGSTVAVGKGPFKVVVMRAGGSESREFNGDVEFTLRKSGDKLQIKSFFFTYAQNGG